MRNISSYFRPIFASVQLFLVEGLCLQNKNFPYERLNLMLASGIKPFWLVERLHAGILLSVGCVSVRLNFMESLVLTFRYHLRIIK